MFENLKQARNRARDGAAARAQRGACRALMSARGTANGVKFAGAVIDLYRALNPAARGEFFTMLAEEFSPDPQQVLEYAQRYAKDGSAQSQVQLFHAVEPPRQELLRRIIRAPGGAATVLGMRTDLIAESRHRPELAAVEDDFQHLLSSWFNPGFLNMVRVDWGSPARLLEQIIQHEAVHAIRDWDDLRRRLRGDRRCFAFLHPALPEDLLIFVEVALLNAMPEAIEPLIESSDVDPHPERARVAVFYSISNCQPGLRGVSLGNSLIKQVCETLKAEFPNLNRYCTLSPMPRFAAWLRKGAPLDAARLPRGAVPRIERARDLLRAAYGERIDSAGLGALEGAAAPLREALLRLGAAYLLQARDDDAASDPVAKFHLHNGASIERLNFLANRSPRGLAESCGLMVNYLYDLRAIEYCHEGFVQGRIEASHAVRKSV